MANVASVQKALKKLKANVVISQNLAEVATAEKIILPGVGAFGEGMDSLRKLGLVDVLNDKVIKQHTPFLGICLGMQMLAEVGLEFGEHKGLGWIAGKTVKLESPGLRLPHVGWNNISIVKDSPLLVNLPDENFYFVHSYCLSPEDQSVVAATCDYGQTFVASVQKDHIFGTQFHPEKSQSSGLQVLKNFLDYAQ